MVDLPDTRIGDIRNLSKRRLNKLENSAAYNLTKLEDA